MWQNQIGIMFYSHRGEFHRNPSKICWIIGKNCTHRKGRMDYSGVLTPQISIRDSVICVWLWSMKFTTHGSYMDDIVCIWPAHLSVMRPWFIIGAWLCWPYVNTAPLSLHPHICSLHTGPEPNMTAVVLHAEVLQRRTDIGLVQGSDTRLRRWWRFG